MSPATLPVRVALIGAGSMGLNHARVLSRSRRVRLVRIVEPRPDVGREVADRFNTHWAPDVDALSGVDAVVIAAPTEVHFTLARHVLDLGKPLLIEKPVSSDLGEADELVRLAREHGIPLMCGFVERFNPAILTVLPLLNAPVHIATVRHGPYAPRIKTGVAWDLLIHDVDACLRLMGAEAISVRAGLGYYHPNSMDGAEDVTEAVIGFSGSRIATTSASRIVHRKIRSISINEVDRSIEVDLLRRDVTIYRHVAAAAATPEGRGYRQQSIIEIPELISSREPLAAQLDRFVDLVCGKADLAREWDSILPAHRVVAEVKAAPAAAGWAIPPGRRAPVSRPPSGAEPRDAYPAPTPS